MSRFDPPPRRFPSVARGSQPQPPKTGPGHDPSPRCLGCGGALGLADLSRLWPLPADAHRRRPPLRHAVGEAICPACRYPNYLRFPTSQVTQNVFGLPDEVADRIVAYAIGQLSQGNLKPAESFREFARFWSFVHRLTQSRGEPKTPSRRD